MTLHANQPGTLPLAATGGSPPDSSRWLNVLSDLHYDPARGIAPHKPLLLLVLCDLAEEGKLGTSIPQRNGDLAFLWKKLEPRRKARRRLRSRLSKKKLKKLDLAAFAKARPPQDCIGQWTAP